MDTFIFHPRNIRYDSKTSNASGGRWISAFSFCARNLGNGNAGWSIVVGMYFLISFPYTTFLDNFIQREE